MASREVETYAFEHELSFRQAKKMLRKKRKTEDRQYHVVRGQPVKGTGRPKGAKK